MDALGTRMIFVRFSCLGALYTVAEYISCDWFSIFGLHKRSWSGLHGHLDVAGLFRKIHNNFLLSFLIAQTLIFIASFRDNDVIVFMHL